MFSWATSTFESLAQTVAPPPTDPNSRIHLACQKRDENTILDIAVSQAQQGMLHPTHTIIHESKGYTLLHLSCLYSLPRTLQYCLDQLQQESQNHPSYYLLVTDKEGNTPLHCAAISNQGEALEIIKRLLSVESSFNNNGGSGSSSTTTPIITVQNMLGKTPYDVATVNSIRQYLLPIQLQAETQMAINNGGIGLPPGIDMGGLTIQNAAHLPPPPTSMAMFGSGPGSGTGVSMYAPIPGLNVSSTNPPPVTAATTTSTPMAQAAMFPPTIPNETQPREGQPLYHNNFDSQYSSPVDYNNTSTPTSTSHEPINATPDPHIGMTMQRHLSSSSTNDVTAQSSIPRPPSSTGSLTGSSSSYALTGRSSAAIFTKSTKGGIQPDGFHSSSSDKNLQEKYGNVNVSNTALPPPPSSGNYTPDMSASAQQKQQPLSAPPSMSGSNNAISSSYVNPFAGGMAAAATGAFRTSARRYVTYDPIAPNRPSQPLHQSSQTQQQQQQQPAVYNQYQQPQQQPMQPQVQQPFNPALNGNNFQQPQQASTVSFTVPPAPFSGPNSTGTFSSPGTFIGKTPANTPMLSSFNATTPSATSTFMSPPPSGMAASFNTTTQPVTVAPQPFASASSPDRSGSGGTSQTIAASVFGTPPPGAPVAASSPTDEATRPLQHGYHRSNSTSSDAAALFSKPITTTETIETAPIIQPTPLDSAAMQNEEPQQQDTSHIDTTADVAATGITDAEYDDDLDDVPLTPGQDMTHQHVQGNEQSVVPNPMNSLIASIGMPPPPFSRK